MSEISYADPDARAPGLSATDSAEAETSEVRGRRARLAAAIPLVITATAHWVFFIAYWIPETSTFPAHEWWLTQLSPLVSPGLTSAGRAQVEAQQAQSGVPGLLLLTCSLGLLWLARTRHWWGRAAMVVPTASGALVTLVSVVALLISGALDSSAVSVALMTGWVGAAGYATYHGHALGQVLRPTKTWRSGLALLAAYALIGPAPVAVGRCLFGGTLRDAAAGLQVNTVSLRLAAMLTTSTALLYLSGLLVGLAIWVGYQWWPPRRRMSSVWLTLALVATLFCTGWLSWPANTAAERRSTTLGYASPAEDQHFPCGSRLLRRDATSTGPLPAQTLVVSGFRCRTVTTYAGYRQLTTRTLAESVSPVTAVTPEGRSIPADLVLADYDDVLVVASSDRLDGRAGQLVALRAGDGAVLWTYTCASSQGLAIRFAGVPGGEQPDLGHLTIREHAPRVVTRCDGQGAAFDPVSGPAG